MKVHVQGLAGQAYAGVGSRSTPAKVLQWMESIGRAMAEAGMVLRSGAAEGADSAFERGCDSVGGDKRIYLPRAGFKGRRADGVKVLVGAGAWAQALGRKHHPAWEGPNPTHPRSGVHAHGGGIGAMSPQARETSPGAAVSGGS